MMRHLIGLLALLAALPAFSDTLAGEREQHSAAAVAHMIEELGLLEAAVPVRELPGWSVPRKVVARLDDPDLLAALQTVAPGVEVVAVETAAQAIKAAADAQVLLGFCNEEILSEAPGLHWIQVYWAGVDRCVTNPGMRTGNKLLTNAQRIASPALAEHAIALMLALVRGLDLYHVNQGQGVWKRDVGLESKDFMELEGRTALIVGLGGIGAQTARRAHGLGMRIIATRGSSREGPDYVEYVGLSDEVLELAKQADVVINTAPLTDRTRGMFDAEFFRAMKTTAFFVSVGRGASTVTDDLVLALEQGQIAGAGLDVTDPEPLPEGHALWSAPRVIISPHTAGRSDRGRDRLFLLVRENLRRYAAGEPMLSVVDIERGY